MLVNIRKTHKTIIGVFYDVLHPLLIRIVKKQRKHDLIIINDNPGIDNAIYAISHFCCHDFPYASEVIRKRTWVLVGKQRLDIASLVGFLLNGVIWVDRKSKKSKQSAAKKLANLLKCGEDISVYPEGTWNMSQSLPILPLYWGIIDIAKESRRPIIPLVLEYEKDKCYARFGSPIWIKANDDKKQKIDELRDQMATLKWDIWQKKPIIHREDFLFETWKKELNYRLAEYPPLNEEYEKSIVREG